MRRMHTGRRCGKARRIVAARQRSWRGPARVTSFVGAVVGAEAAVVGAEVVEVEEGVAGVADSNVLVRTAKEMGQRRRAVLSSRQICAFYIVRCLE
mmetsp:Transcript_4314/g.15503  ORF Transcript_4314/g.15503 Transcript_4314/m.15503 type:complete len:96 (+) Transcript_4314:1094-1381(+)